MNNPKHLFLFVGRIASGKETQGQLLADKLDAPMFMTGGKIREIMASDSQLGKRLKDDYNKGLLMPAWFATYLFQDFLLNLPDDTHAVFEGTGRAVAEAEDFHKTAAWLGRPYTVFNLVVTPETVMERSLSRGRDVADTEEAVKTRLAEYEKTTAPAIEYFKEQGVAVDIDGEKPVEAIHEEVMQYVTNVVS
ncbi:MAG: nucleoside monophosphate kinase [Patescibacteria group bacterium UBA2163]